MSACCLFKKVYCKCVQLHQLFLAAQNELGGGGRWPAKPLKPSTDLQLEYIDHNNTGHEGGRGECETKKEIHRSELKQLQNQYLQVIILLEKKLRKTEREKKSVCNQTFDQ